MTRIIQAYGSPPAKAGDILSIAVEGKVAGGMPPVTYSNQWHRDGLPIKGETADRYTVVSADDGKRITCVTTATDAIGRKLVLAPSNEVLINRPARGKEGTRPCPPVEKKECAKAPEIEKKAAAASSPKTQKAKTQGAKASAKPVAKAKPSSEQIRREMRKAGGCRSCGGRRRG